MEDTTATAPASPMTGFAGSAFEFPKFEMPKFEMPNFDMPKMEIPAAFRDFAERASARRKRPTSG